MITYAMLQVKAMELYDALESSGSYSKAEITERVDKYRNKLMQVHPYELCTLVILN